MSNGYYYNITPSLLNNYHQLISGEYERWGKTAQDFLTEIMTPFATNESMSRGTAYGYLLEHGPSKYHVQGLKQTPDGKMIKVDEYQVYEKSLRRTWVFTHKEVAPVIEYRERYPLMTYEVWANHELMIGFDKIKMAMRVDGLLGLDIHENKTSAYANDWSSREGSYQWRCYLTALKDAQKVVYHEFQFVEAYGNRKQKVTYLTHEQERYDGVEDDVNYLLKNLLQWLKFHPKALELRTRKEV